MNAPEYPRFSIWGCNFVGMMSSVVLLWAYKMQTETKKQLDHIEKQGGVQSVDQIAKSCEKNKSEAEYKLVSGLLMRNKLSSKNEQLLKTQGFSSFEDDGERI